MILTKRGVLAVMAAVLPSLVFGQDSVQHGRYASCESGNCDNGRGTMVYHVYNNRVTGEWRDGRYVDGAYDVTYGQMPFKTFKVVYGSDGMPREGTLVRGNGVFMGTFSRVVETFSTEGSELLPLFQRETVVFRSGRYVDPRGYVYEGEFDYIPLLRTIDTPQFGTTKIAQGVFVFLGVRIDEALDEVKRGLFVSNETGPGEQVFFSQASPSYLAKLREELVASRARDGAERAEEARSSREAFNTILGVVGVVATVAVLNKVMSSGSDRAALNSLNQTMSGNETPTQAANTVGAAMKQRDAVAGVPRQTSGSGASTVTVAQYQAAQLRRIEAVATQARAGNTQSNAGVTSAAIGGSSNASSGGLAPANAEFRIVSTTDSDHQLEEHQTKTWCQKKPRYLRTAFSSGSNKLISVGVCSCKPIGAVSMQQLFKCEIPYTYKEYVNYSK